MTGKPTASAADSAVLPAEMTPAIAGVLGLMCFRTGPLAQLYRAAGHDIPRRIEDEQAFILFRFLHLALQHGDGWFDASRTDVELARATAKARLQGEAQTA